MDRTDMLKVLKKILRCRVIFDYESKMGEFDQSHITKYEFALKKEELSRKYILNKEGQKLRFLDVGGKDGELRYMLGIHRNLVFDEDFYNLNKKKFSEKYDYFGLDLNENDRGNIVSGDICSESFFDKKQDLIEAFDIVYSNNVFEHLKKPWQAASNIYKLLKPEGMGIIIAPFSIRYHEDPIDYFRYTHTGLRSLFETCGNLQVLENGYDISCRRNNWQGSGLHNDIVPVDKFGAWRETWFSVLFFKKII